MKKTVINGKQIEFKAGEILTRQKVEAELAKPEPVKQTEDSNSYDFKVETCPHCRQKAGVLTVESETEIRYQACAQCWLNMRKAKSLHLAGAGKKCDFSGRGPAYWLDTVKGIACSFDMIWRFGKMADELTALAKTHRNAKPAFEGRNGKTRWIED